VALIRAGQNKTAMIADALEPLTEQAAKLLILLAGR